MYEVILSFVGDFFDFGEGCVYVGVWFVGGVESDCCYWVFDGSEVL